MDKLISLERCRKLLGPNNKLSDETLATLREHLYCFAELALDVRNRQGSSESKPDVFEKVARSPEALEDLRERAAIIEFDGNVSREEAERMALNLSLASERVN